jgi:hypothetical protein
LVVNEFKKNLLLRLQIGTQQHLKHTIEKIGRVGIIQEIERKVVGVILAWTVLALVKLSTVKKYSHSTLWNATPAV